MQRPPTVLIQEAANRFRALADETRIALLVELKASERNVTALMQLTGLRQANVSKHLGILRRAGLVEARRDGVQMFYRIKAPWVYDLCDLMCAGIKDHHEELAQGMGITKAPAKKKIPSESKA